MRLCNLSTSLPGWLSRRWAIALTLASLALIASAAVLGAGKAKNEVTPAGKADGKADVKTDTVHISFQTVPPRKAMVKWGKKSLGVIPVPRPLVVERPRDSGPMDVVIRASGYLPVHTRAYTFSDSRVAVKLTAPAEKKTLFGYRQEAPQNPDGGVQVPEPVAAPQPQ
jgi:hypothetical protein